MAENPSRLSNYIYGLEDAGDADAWRQYNGDQGRRSPRQSDDVSIATLFLNDTAINKTATYSLDSPVSRIYQNNQDSVVQVSTIDKVLPNNKVVSSDGSGFFVDKSGLIATDYHVIKDAQGRIEVRTANGETYKAKVVDVDPAHDIALLKVEPQRGLNIVPVTLARSGNLQGQELMALGYPQGSSMHVSSGVFTDAKKLSDFRLTDGAMPGEDANRTVFTAEMNVQKGSSGGPIYRESDGAVVGLVGLSDKAGKLTLGTPVADLQRLIAKAKPDAALSETVIAPGLSPLPTWRSWADYAREKTAPYYATPPANVYTPSLTNYGLDPSLLTIIKTFSSGSYKPPS